MDWPEISRRVRFDRAGGRCEGCGQAHMSLVGRLPDGRWTDASVRQVPMAWFTGSGRLTSPPANAELLLLRWVRVVLTTAHLDHDPTNNADENLRALCGRCHLAYDLGHHKVQRRLRYRLRWALADLFEGVSDALRGIDEPGRS
jgi:hypothetical protein